MGDTMTTIHDVEAISDVLNDIGEASDSMGVQDGLEMHRTLTELKRKVGETIGLIESQMISILESPRVMEGMRYEVANDGKWRPDHMAIQGAVKKDCVVDENGELRHATDAVDRAITRLYALFVANATMPKVGGLEDLGLDKSDVARFESKGKKLKVTIAEPDAP